MMSNPHFEKDQFPECPKILFIGIAGSSHTISWINLLSQARINVRLFAMPDSGFPPPNWDVRTYLSTSLLPKGLDPQWRSCSHLTPELQAEADPPATNRVLQILYHLKYKIEIKPYESELFINTQKLFTRDICFAGYCHYKKSRLAPTYTATA